MAITFVNGKAVAFGGLVLDVIDYNPLRLPRFTIRVKYLGGEEPGVENVTKTLVDPVNNIWDIKYENPDWSLLFSREIYLSDILGANLVGVNDLYYTFNDCANLSSVALFDVSTVSSLYGTFYYCNSLSSIPLFNTKNVTITRGMLGMCSTLSAVPKYNTSNVQYMQGMFNSCSALTKIEKYDTSNVIMLDRLYYNCSGLTTIPALNTSSVTNMELMAGNCTGLTAIPLFDTTNVVNMNSAFMGCNNVKEGALALYQQASTQTTPPNAHSDTFKGCGSATSAGSAELAQIPTSWGGTAV